MAQTITWPFILRPPVVLGFVVVILLLTIGVEALWFVVDSYLRQRQVGAHTPNEQVSDHS